MYKIMPERLEETVKIKGDEDLFKSLFDKFVFSASVKHSLRLDDKPFRSKHRETPQSHGSRCIECHVLGLQ